MASTETLEQVKKLIKQELAPVQAKLGELASRFGELEKAANFLSSGYDSILKQLQDTNQQVRTANQKFKTQSSEIAALKDETKNLEKNAHDAAFQLDEIAQYIRRDCLEVTGVKASEECTADAIVKSVGELIGVPLEDNDISIAHPIPTYSEVAAPKLIVKFMRRSVRNKVYSSRRKLVKKKAKDLPNLGLAFEDDLYISESLTQTRKKLFGEVNKMKKQLKWKFIWTFNGRIFIRKADGEQAHAFDCQEDLEKFKVKFKVKQDRRSSRRSNTTGVQ